MAKPTDNTPKKSKSTKKTTKKSKKIINVPEEVLAPFTNPQETAVPSASRPNDTGIGIPMQSIRKHTPAGISEADVERAEKEAEATTPVDNSVDANIDNAVDTPVQEDAIPTNETPNSEEPGALKTPTELYSMVAKALKPYPRIRRVETYQDTSKTYHDSTGTMVYDVLCRVARDERIALASLLTAGGGDLKTSLQKYELHGMGDIYIGTEEDMKSMTCLISLTPKKRFLGLSKQTNVQVHADLSATLEAMKASYNQESVVEDNNNNSEQTPNWFNRTRTHMADGLGSAKDRMSDANIGERMTKVAKTTGSWIGNAALSVAERIIENLGLAAKWTLVSFYGMWYYIIVVMAMGSGASLGAALLVGLYIMAVWTLKTFAWVMAWFVALDFAIMGYDKLKTFLAERKFATTVATATA